MSYTYLLSDKHGKRYLGKTSNLEQRLDTHRSDIKIQGKCSSRELDIDFTYEILEEVRCDGRDGRDGRDVLLAEAGQKWYDICRVRYGDKLVNKNRPLNTQKQYNEQHIEDLNEYRKKYYIEHIEKIKERVKKYQAEHTDEVREYNKKYQAEHAEALGEHKKKYRAVHREKTKEYNKNYRDINSVELNKRLSEKFTCECGGTFSLWNKSRHEKTKKHVSITLQQLKIKIELHV